MPSGYQGPNYPLDEKEKTKPPEDCEWSVEILNVADNDEDSEVVFAAINADGQVLGSVRLPNAEYLRWLRERVQNAD